MVPLPLRLAILLLTLSVGAQPAGAAERRVSLTSYDRVRVDGPLTVRVVTRGAPGARVSGVPAALGAVDVRLAGGTAIVRRTGALPAGVPAPVLELSLDTLRGASVSGEGQLELSGPLDAARLDLTVTGRGGITARAIASEALTVTLIGEGQFTLAGRAGRARILANGGGAIVARELVADDAVIRSEGFTAIDLTARYTANASTTGRGMVTILGRPECRYREVVADTVVCHARKKF